MKLSIFSFLIIAFFSWMGMDVWYSNESEGQYQWLSQYATFEVSSRDIVHHPFYNTQNLLNGKPYIGTRYDWAFHTRTNERGKTLDSTPYVIVDLGDVADIRQVSVENSLNFKDERKTNGLTAWVSEDKNKWKKVWKAESYDDIWTFSTKNKGRYLKLGFEEKREYAFFLKRIKIYGLELEGKSIFTTPDRSSLDSLLMYHNWISKGASYEVSSKGYWDRYARPEKLLDGSSYPNSVYDFAFHTRSADHGQTVDSIPFVIIDLKKEAHLQTVFIRNRMEVKRRADGLVAWISSDKQQWKKINEIEEFHADWKFGVNQEGRYLKLGFEQAREQPFHLQSVWVFGSFLADPFVGEWFTADDNSSIINIEKDAFSGKPFKNINYKNNAFVLLDGHKEELVKLFFLGDGYLLTSTKKKSQLLKKTLDLPNNIILSSPPASIDGNWFNTSEGPYWQLGVMPDVLIYENRIWDYEKIVFGEGAYHLYLSRAGEKKLLKLTTEGWNSIQVVDEGGGKTKLTNDREHAVKKAQNKAEKKFSTTQVVVQGYIDGFKFSEDKFPSGNDKLVFIVNNLVYGDQITNSSTYNATGEFVSTFDIPNAQDIYFKNGKGLKTMFVAPGDTITMYLKANSNDGVLFMGDHADVSSNLFEHANGIQSVLPSYQQRKEKILALEPGEYKDYRKELMLNQEDYLGNLFEQNPQLSELFKEWANLTVTFDYYDDLMRYRWLRSSYSQGKKDRFETHTDFFDFLQKIDFDEPKHTITSSFGSTVGEVVQNLLRKNQNQRALGNSFLVQVLEETVGDRLSAREREILEKLKTIAHIESEKDSLIINSVRKILGKYSEDVNQLLQRRIEEQRLTALQPTIDSIPSNVLKELIVTRNIYRDLRTKDLEGAKWQYGYYERSLKTTAYKELLDREFKKLEDLIASDIPDYIQLNEIPESEGENLLKSIIEKHKGKVLYLDFWATWCGPCITSFERVKAIKEQYKEKGVVFIYLCGSNSNKKSYENILKAKDVKGEHYYLTESQWKTIWKKFEIRDIPHYALINKKGQVEEGKAPSPYNGILLTNKLNELTAQ